MSVLRVVNFGSAKGGLATVGYTIYGVDGVAIGSRITAGVTEIGTNTGIYAADVLTPDYNCIVLWDTGEATPKYATEDYQQQLQSIAEETGQINKIYNSLRNQGEFFSALMDRMGMLVKNEGLERVEKKVDSLSQRESPITLNNIEEAFARAAGKINLTAVATSPQVNIPEVKIPDYTSAIDAIKSLISGLKGEIVKIPKSQYSGNFSSLIGIINSLEQKMSIKTGEIASEVKGIKNIFTKFDNLLEKINSFQDKLNSLDTNDKDIIKTRQEIADDIKRLNLLLSQVSMTMLAKENRGINEVLLSLGHIK